MSEAAKDTSTTVRPALDKWRGCKIAIVMLSSLMSLGRLLSCLCWLQWNTAAPRAEHNDQHCELSVPMH